MERKELKMYSDYKSPFAYLAFDPAFALQERFAVRVRWIPFQLRIKDRGQRSAYSDYKAKYSYLDARRWAKPRGILIRAPQKVYDTAPALIGGLFAESKGLLLEYSRKAYESFFRREFEADDPEAVAALLVSLGLSAAEYREYLAARARGSTRSRRRRRRLTTCSGCRCSFSSASRFGATIGCRCSSSGSSKPDCPSRANQSGHKTHPSPVIRRIAEAAQGMRARRNIVNKASS